MRDRGQQARHTRGEYETIYTSIPSFIYQHNSRYPLQLFPRGYYSSCNCQIEISELDHLRIINLPALDIPFDALRTTHFPPKMLATASVPKYSNNSSQLFIVTVLLLCAVPNDS